MKDRLLIVDSREKWTQGGDGGRLKAYFEKHCEYQIHKLDVGDYTLEGGRIVIDRKQDLNELAKNLTNPADHSRFMKEIRRAKERGLKLIVLCEHGGKVKSIKDVAQWRSKYSPVSGRALMERIYQVHISYGVEFMFCDKRVTGQKILELLEVQHVRNNGVKDH